MAQRADKLQHQLFAHYKSIGQDLQGKTWKRGLKPVYRSQAMEADIKAEAVFE